MAYRDYSTALGRIVDPSGKGDFSTIAAALTASTSGQTIFVRPGTYTENLTLKAGVNICAFVADASLNETGHVIINGNATMTTAGTVTLSGIQLQTNSAAFLTVSGSAASIVNIINCCLNCSNATGISYSSSSSSSQINIYHCVGNLATTGIGLYSMSSAGVLNIEYVEMSNTGASTTASTSSSGNVQIRYCTLPFAISTSSTSIINLRWCIIFNSPINTTCLTTAGTQSSTVHHCRLLSGSAPALSIGTGTEVDASNCSFQSSNTNCVAGAGTLGYGNISFTGTSDTIQSTITQSPFSMGARVNIDDSCQILAGSGSPNGVITAPKGSLFLRTDGTTVNNRAFINTDSGTTWTALTTLA